MHVHAGNRPRMHGCMHSCTRGVKQARYAFWQSTNTCMQSDPALVCPCSCACECASMHQGTLK
eukprot:2076495-Lingulodinium_polyedra.AAC.1